MLGQLIVHSIEDCEQAESIWFILEVMTEKWGKSSDLKSLDYWRGSGGADSKPKGTWVSDHQRVSGVHIFAFFYSVKVN